MHLSDGRRIGCLQVGSSDGFPVFHFHGNGSSRLEVTLLEDVAAAAGARLIGLDRPGIGDSDPAPGRTLLDWPNDVVQVADQLGIGRFAISGFSAGGAYALACAHRLADRISGCALISSICPPELVLRQAPAWTRTGWWLAQHHPELVHAGLQMLLPDLPSDELSAEIRLSRITSWLAPPDRNVLQQPQVRHALLRAMTESRRQGTTANRLEILALLRDWNLRLDQITLRGIALWHGERDRLTPVGPARLLAELLPQCKATFCAGEGHFSTLARHAGDVIAALAP
ncbi:MAG TPA: alpha/beta hydrolase [Burkholderiaceae bacterium]|jgi:pimeloyl-ACP methyl ester carboxylesterase|nr:alpha/beta hydrolase [Burkholderiaceae bacterium]